MPPYAHILYNTLFFCFIGTSDNAMHLYYIYIAVLYYTATSSVVDGDGISVNAYADMRISVNAYADMR
jgi:hypothetical protein